MPNGKLQKASPYYDSIYLVRAAVDGGNVVLGVLEVLSSLVLPHSFDRYEHHIAPPELAYGRVVDFGCWLTGDR